MLLGMNILSKFQLPRAKENNMAFNGWAKENNMAFNGSKFEVLRFGKNQEIKDNTNYLTPEA